METQERIPQTPPIIAPLGIDVPRVLWSVMIPAYNCSKYLTETINSVLLQDLGADIMQIEVIDDCSTDDDVQRLVETVGKGRVSYYRQKENVGSLRNFETCINRARGKYIHLLHGDDRVLPGYYAGIQNEFDLLPEAGAVYSAWRTIDEHGNIVAERAEPVKDAAILEQSLLKLARLNLIQYVSITVKREVYEKVGSFYAARYGEDWLMWVTISKHFPIVFLPKTFAEYRLHKTSISSDSLLSGEHFVDIKKIFSLTKPLLPPDRQKEVILYARKDYAYYSLQLTSDLWHSIKKTKPVLRQITGLLNFYVDAHILKGIGHLLSWLAKDELRKLILFKKEEPDNS
ncbi:glycosyltransferase [Mucilaginibacter sp. CSA2-8R]|uniref:glycosyltransferase family 2 protein n=1 Tax=Mucilaginibacter sp. CSA2-8R TaxID=3141542 RepID=UPI00315D883C